MIRVAAFALLYCAVAALIRAQHPSDWVILSAHAAFGFSLTVGFDALRIALIEKRPRAALTTFMIGILVRTVMVGLYGVLHMFAGHFVSRAMFLSFAGSIVVSLLFSVAWEAGCQISSLRK